MIEELWIEFGKSKDRKWTPVHIYTKTLVQKIFQVLFCYALTVCDIVLQFAYVEMNSMEDLACIYQDNRSIFKA